MIAGGADERFFLVDAGGAVFRFFVAFRAGDTA